ncbi:hypothetical protein BASA62_010093 [Batrachochytrium salamandrivorans]|nr:hypothetical protein BASA62_010093 [Batrachochytrium salamandrivorans]
MFDPLLWVLYHFITHYAGQTTQGDTNDGDAVDQVSGSKDVTSLPLGADDLKLLTTLKESNTPDQSDTSAPADPQSEEECKGGHRIRKKSSPCPQKQTLPEPQPPTSYVPDQSDEMPLPAYVKMIKFNSYTAAQNTDQYDAFITSEAQYFESEYSGKKELGEGKYGAVYLAIRNSNGMKVAYKSISRADVREYTLDPTSPPRCHTRNPTVLSEEQSVEQCISSRPQNLLLPHELALQMYLSRPGHENPHVPEVLDYIILEDKFILVMEYFDEKWVSLSSYVEEKGQLDIDTIRSICREILNGMLSLKRHGVAHDDLHGMSQ